MECYKIKVSLKDFSPEIWRKLIIPKNITFLELDKILKILWNFSGDELSTFIVKPNNNLIMDKSIKTKLDPQFDSNTTKINEIFDKYHFIEYLYHFKDQWKFTIEIISEMDYDKNYPHIYGFKCPYNPLEDCGGLWEFSEIIYHEQHPDDIHESVFKNQLTYFKFDLVNEILKNFDFVKD